MAKDHGEESSDVFLQIEKSRVIQETREFDAKQINAEECIKILSKLIYLINEGEDLTEAESTDVFFRITKLFQCPDVNLRRMVYLVLKEIRPKDTEVFIVISSLQRDITGTVDLFRSNSLRVLARILDPSTFAQIERLFKSAIVDKNDVVCSAAMLAGTYLAKENSDVIKRWVNEVQEKLNSNSFNVHYHGLILMHAIKKGDPVGLAKLLISMTRANIKSHLAHCQLIRFIKESLCSLTLDQQVEKVLIEYLENCLHKSNDIVVYEAAKALCERENATTQELTSALTILHLFLSSSRNSVKFAALKTLNKIANVHSKFLEANFADFEALMNDPNRCIATLAISTLLKISSEANVDRILKQITSHIGEISDEFKIDIIHSIKFLCSRMPGKFKPLLNFVTNCLKEEGGFQLKHTIVSCITDIMRDIPLAKDAALVLLAEFSEDCEFDLIQTEVLYLLGLHGPSTSQPKRFIRCICNRLILEKGAVRAAAISALAKFGKVPDLQETVLLLLAKAERDRDDEVRERAAFYTKAVQSEASLSFKLPMPLQELERAALTCKERGIPFKLEDVKQLAQETKAPVEAVDLPAEEEKITLTDDISQFAHFGPVLKMTQPVLLTEKNAEYIVKSNINNYEKYLVIQFTVQNTLDNQIIDNVYVDLSLVGTQFQETASATTIVTAPSIAQVSAGVCFVALEKPNKMPTATISAMLRFTAKEMDGDDCLESYEDEYQLENLEIGLSDY